MPTLQPPHDIPRGGRVLRNLAHAVILVAGMRLAAGVLIPVLIAGLLALLCIPITDRLVRWKVPRWLALVAPLLVLMAVLAGVTAVVSTSVFSGSLEGLSAALANADHRLDELVQAKLDELPWMPTEVARHASSLFDVGKLLDLITDATGSILGAVSNLLLVLIVAVFMMIEAGELPSKLRRSMGRPDADLGTFDQAVRQIHDYVNIKAMMSLLTGALVAVLVSAAGVGFPLILGLIAFLFNFVPTIGSIIAAIPAVLLAWVGEGGIGAAVVVGAGYVAINFAIGNALEPKVMGRKLGLSSLVVVLSLVFWSFVLGPAGMLLSLPLTMIVKIMLEHTDDLKYLAVLLESGVERGDAGVRSD